MRAAPMELAGAAAGVAAGRARVSGPVPEQPGGPTWSHCPQKTAHAFRSACQGRRPSGHCCCHHEGPEGREGHGIASEGTRVRSQGHCSSFCSADPSDASFVVRTDYSGQNGSTWFDFDSWRDDAGTAVERQSLGLSASADPWHSLGFQGNHILRGLQDPH